MSQPKDSAAGADGSSGVLPPNASGDAAADPEFELDGFWPDLKSSIQSFYLRLKAVAPIVGYFWIYWQIKDRFRSALHHGALGYLSASLIFFVFELWLKFFSASLVEEIEASLKGVKPYGLALIAISAAIVVLHSLREIRGKTAEHKTLSAIWHLFNRENFADEVALMRSTLPIIAHSFASSGVLRVSVWLPDGDHLVVKPHCLHHQGAPMQSPILDKLPRDKGIAGLVFKDGKPRYVPRVCFPFNSLRMRRFSKPFLHALTFEPAQKEKTSEERVNLPADERHTRRQERKKATKNKKDEPKQLEVVGKRVSRDAIVLNEQVKIDSLKSFVAVPISSFRQKEKPIGVLCIDFQGTDPLRSDGVKLAAVFGVLLAMDLDRL